MNAWKWFLLILALVSFYYCDKDRDEVHCSDQGIILGPDIRLCACCGGWFIEIDGDTLRANLTTDFVESFDLEDLPLTVTLDWSPADTPCLGDEIEISCIRR